MRTWDWVHETEVQLMLNLNCPLGTIDDTDISSVFGLLGYLDRKKNKKANARVVSLGGKKYRRVTADEASWL